MRFPDNIKRFIFKVMKYEGLCRKTKQWLCIRVWWDFTVKSPPTLTSIPVSIRITFVSLKGGYGNFYTHLCGAQRCLWKYVYCYLTAMWCWLLCFLDCRNIIVISDLSSNLYPHCNLGSVSIGCVHEYCMLTCSHRHCPDQPDYHITWKNRYLIVCYDCHSKDANFNT